MKVLLLSATNSDQVIMPHAWAGYEHLGLASLASTLRADGHDVDIVDDPGRQRIPVKDYGLIGISVLFQDALQSALQMCAAVKRQFPGAHITVGGHPPTFMPEEVLRSEAAVDSVTCGEGEEVMLALASRLERRKTFDDLPGLAFRRGDKVVRNGCAHLCRSLDELRWPARDSLERSGRASAALQGSRGCYAACSFCSVASFYRTIGASPWRGRSATSIVSEAKYLVERFGVRRIQFVDDNFTGPLATEKARAVSIAEGIRSLGIRWKADIRPDCVEEELLRLFRDCGLSEVFVGIESLSERMLRTMGKGVTVQQNLDAIAILKKLNLPVVYGWIMFDPYTTFKEFEDNYFAFRRTIGGGAFDIMALTNRLQVFPGTPIEKRLERENRLMRKGFNIDYRFLDDRVSVLYSNLQTTSKFLFTPMRLMYAIQAKWDENSEPADEVDRARYVLAKEAMANLQTRLIENSIEMARKLEHIRIEPEVTQRRRSIEHSLRLCF